MDKSEGKFKPTELATDLPSYVVEFFVPTISAESEDSDSSFVLTTLAKSQVSDPSHEDHVRILLHKRSNRDFIAAVAANPVPDGGSLNNKVLSKKAEINQVPADPAKSKSRRNHLIKRFQNSR